MYQPFNNTCKCGALMHPLDELHPDNTQPKTHRKEVTIMFWCDVCSHAESYTYVLPTLQADISKNLIRLICQAEEVVLGHPITLNTSNFIEEKGIRWGLADLQYHGVVENIDLAALTFKLTLAGLLLVWHGAY